eukprot:11424335-Prorocentrum_lima.AAC.1
MFLKSDGTRQEEASEANAWAKTLTGVDLTTRAPFIAALEAETPAEFVVTAVVKWLDSLGHLKLRLASDGEPSLVALLNK